MIQPVAFGFNAETAANNFFQQEADKDPAKIQALALEEFTVMVNKIRTEDIRVVVLSDTLSPHTPDSIFPNNWISFHPSGSAVVYPMYAANRRNERKKAVLDQLSGEGFNYPEIMDLTAFEHHQLFLEGTGSMVLDRCNKIAYAALSGRTSQEVLDVFCTNMGYKAVSFTANQQVESKRLPIYHTNVMMCIAEQYAVICMESIDDVKERDTVINSLRQSKKTIIELTEHQLNCFAGNMLQVKNKHGKLKLILSATAYESLTSIQLRQLSSYNDLIVCPVSTIEKYGGGSVRCMIAELF